MQVSFALSVVQRQLKSKASKEIDAVAMIRMDVNMTEWSWDMVLKLYSSCLLANTGTQIAITMLSPPM